MPFWPAPFPAALQEPKTAEGGTDGSDKSGDGHTQGWSWAEAMQMRQGECLFHSGGLTHGALPVGAGSRYVAIFFFDRYDQAVVADG